MNSCLLLLGTLLLCCGSILCGPETVYSMYLKCEKQYPVSAKEMKELQLHPDYKPSENVKCLTKCLIDKLGFIKDNVFDVEHTKAWWKDRGVDMFEFLEKIDECATYFKGDGSCDDVYQLNMCMHFT